MMDNIEGIILAAGQSSRLGQIKQLVNLKGTPLLRHVINEVKGAGIERPKVILGANSVQIREEIDLQDVDVIENPNWEKGMSSSLVCGIESINPNATHACIFICDQLFLTSELIVELIEKSRIHPQKIVSCQYALGYGPPSIFPKVYFSRLSKLHGDKGAKNLLSEYKENIEWVSFLKGNLDLDKPEDLNLLLNFNP